MGVLGTGTCLVGGRGRRSRAQGFGVEEGAGRR